MTSSLTRVFGLRFLKSRKRGGSLSFIQWNENLFNRKLIIYKNYMKIYFGGGFVDTKKVGFIGLGNMGFPMAKNLLKAGFTVYGVDVNKESEKQLADIGGKVGFNYATLQSEVNIIFTSLPTPQIVESVYLGNEKRSYREWRSTININ